MNELHTKYRPQTFEGVLGHDLIVRALEQALADGTSRSFIFVGGSGVGKTTLARIVANKLGCTAENVIEIDAATYNGIDSMRTITERLNYRPFGKNKSRVIIVDEAHALSKAAWQSLLKSVEEPPPGVYWIFCTTEAGKIPTTISNRCNVFELKPVNRDLVFELLAAVVELEKLSVPEDVLSFISRRCMGSPRRALTFLSQCSTCKTVSEASELIRETTDDDEGTIELARSLVKGSLTWERAVQLIKTLEDTNPETVRMTIVSYVSTVLLSTKDEKSASVGLSILEAFSTPFTQNGVHQILLAVGALLFGEQG